MTLVFICDLAVLTDWTPLLIHLHHSFSSSTGLSDVPSPVWNEAQSNKHSAPGSDCRITTLSFLEKYSQFICIARSPLMAALMLLYALALDHYTHLWSWYKVPKFLHLRKEWNWIFGLLQTHMILLLQKQWSACSVCSEQTPFNIKYACVHPPWHAHTHTHMQHHLHMFQLLLNSVYLLHVLFIV